MATIILTNEQGGGKEALGKPCRVEQDTLPLRERLRLRAYGAAKAHAREDNAHENAVFSGLAQPGGGPKCRVDAGAQFHKALEAFERRAFTVLVDDEQVNDLDTVLSATS